MTLRHRFTLRSFAAAGILGLTASSAVVLGATAPASAAKIALSCEVPVLGTKTFAVDITTNAPANAAPGSSLTPRITSKITVPADIADLMRGFLGANAIAGTVESVVKVDGVAQTTTITIPRTNVPASGPVVLTGTGQLSSIAAGPAGGRHTIAAGAQNVAMMLFQPGSPDGSLFPVPCAPAAGQSTTISTIAVRGASTTKAKAVFSAKKHKATVSATVSSTPAATGTVTFTLKRGAKKVKTVRASVVRGKATATFKKLRQKGKYTVTAAYSGSSTVAPSTGTAKLRVR
ncbi:DUF6801 domain-containing protein [Pimelobacter simplex]|uniref:Ig-like domain-containing protein n=1 Tax=Nocardioides simplex TaxID=2045 RepID=UPI003AB02230